MPTVSAVVSRSDNDFIERLVKEERFMNKSDVIRSALRLLREKVNLE